MNSIPDVVVTIDEYWLTMLVSVFLPMLVALITTRLASSSVKAVLLILLSAVSGWLTSLYATGGTFELKAAAVGVFLSFLSAVGVHYGLLKPTGITGNTGSIMDATPDIGIGPKHADPR